MRGLRDTRILTVILLMFLILHLDPLVTQASIYANQIQGPGPSLNRIVYKIEPDKSAMVQSLLQGDIDVIFDRYDDVSTFQQLKADSSVEIAEYARNGYGYFPINCEKYPLSETALRRAISLAINKTAICEEAWSGLARPQDSPLPKANPFCIDGSLSYNYYDADIDLANQILDDAGFLIPEGETFRRAPNNDTFGIVAEVGADSWLASPIIQNLQAAFDVLHIDGEAQMSSPTDYIPRIMVGGDYDMGFIGLSRYDYNVDWLPDFVTQFSRFSNVTFDSYANTLHNAGGIEEAMEALYQIQSIAIYESPIIVCYNNFEFGAYRTDKFEGFVYDSQDSIPCWWTNLLAHLRSNEPTSYGGELRIGIPEDVSSFNFMTADTDFERVILSNLYDTLLRIAPNGTYVPWLAKSIKIDTHETNLSIPVDRTVVTIELEENIRWSDGMLLTSSDVEYSLMYYYLGDSNPYGIGLDDLYSISTPDAYTVVAEFTTDVFLDYYALFEKPILPAHSFGDPEDWSTWNPNPLTEIGPTCGPYIIVDYTEGDSIELYYQIQYFKIPGPSVSSPEDITINWGESGRSFTWTVTARGPSRYDFILDGAVLNRSERAVGILANPGNETITVSLDELAVGVHEFEIYAYDLANRSAYDSVEVFVQSTTPEMPDLTIILAGVGVIAVLLILIAAISKARRRNYS